MTNYERIKGMSTASDRDRLIKLINSIDVMKIPTDNFREHLADYLIENGVIVPQCKVGDMVYRIAKDGKTITKERVGAIHVEYTIDNGTGIYDVWWLKDYNIGVTTFLTREEAEAALKGETKQCAK